MAGNGGKPDLNAYLKKTQERFARPFKPVDTVAPAAVDKWAKDPWAPVHSSASTASTFEVS